LNPTQPPRLGFSFEGFRSIVRTRGLCDEKSREMKTVLLAHAIETGKPMPLQIASRIFCRHVALIRARSLLASFAQFRANRALSAPF